VCVRKNNVYIYEIMQDDAALDLLANMTLMEFLRSLHSELSFDDSARLLRSGAWNSGLGDIKLVRNECVDG
jgi:hypothetical protein